MFTLAHFSDPHLGPLPRLRPAELIGKRFFGYLSWMRRRRHIHKQEVLDSLARDLADLSPDHIAVTGDLTNISLPGEFVQVAQWLRGLAAPDRLTVIPGNHDAYVAMPWDQSLGLWSDFMSGDDGECVFPFIRRRGSVALIGLSSALPTPIGFASGNLGRGQLERLETCLNTLGGEGVFRVLLLHHPPQSGGASWRKRLVDAPAFRDVVQRSGAELILHGHNHDFADARVGAGPREIRVFGVPSASAAHVTHKPQAHYSLYGIEGTGTGWEVSVRRRGLDIDRGVFADLGTDRFSVPRE